MNAVLAIDVGATTTRVAVVFEREPISVIRRIATPDSLALLEDRLADVATHLRADSETQHDSLDAICLAVPGVLSADGTAVERSVHCSWLEGAPLAAIVGQRLRAPVHLATDAAAATFGEYALVRNGRAAFAHLRLGTGVAFGLIIDGQWQTLGRPHRGHLSCLRLPSEVLDVRCSCGQRGCLEAVASGAALERATHATGYAGGLAALQAAFDRGDAPAAEIVGAACEAVLRVAGGIIRRWRVDALVLGGGVCTGLPCLEEMLLRRGAGDRKLPLQAARLGDDAGIMGVALACRQERS